MQIEEELLYKRSKNPYLDVPSLFGEYIYIYIYIYRHTHPFCLMTGRAQPMSGYQQFSFYNFGFVAASNSLKEARTTLVGQWPPMLSISVPKLVINSLQTLTYGMVSIPDGILVYMVT
jgi:hypothetical protein